MSQSLAEILAGIPNNTATSANAVRLAKLTRTPRRAQPEKPVNSDGSKHTACASVYPDYLE